MDEDCKKILAWWELGCVSSEDVIAWTDRLIEEIPEEVELPSWLIDLDLKGPRQYLKMSNPEYPRPRNLNYIEKFRAMVEATDPEDQEAVRRFAEWIANAAMGEDLTLDEVLIGYKVEHAFSYENSGDPVEISRDTIRSYRPKCQDIDQVLRRTI